MSICIFEVSSEEVAVLKELLDAEVRDIPSEIRRTQTATYKDDLKRRRVLLRGLAERVARLCEVGVQ